jgi:hypothetical protein
MLEHTYAQLDCKYDALCLKDKIQCLEDFRIHAAVQRWTIKHAFSWLWAMRIKGEYIKVIDHG